ncbi:hypothetical protein, partial [Vibrio parahaemolyticus]
MASSGWRVVFDKEGTTNDTVYTQKVTIEDISGEVIGTFKGSSTPNPFKPSDASLTGFDAYPYIKGGSYLLTHGM